MNQHLIFTIVSVIFGLLLVFILLAPRMGLGPTLQKFAADTYQKRFFKQLKKKYPKLAERLQDFELKPENQEGLQQVLMKQPPQEAQRFQQELMRTKDWLVAKHPEVEPLVSAGQDGRAQGKALDGLLKLPDAQRAGLEKDLLDSWDRLRKAFPRIVSQIESVFRKKEPVAAK